MKIKEIKDPFPDHCEKVNFEDSQLEIKERMGEMHLLIFAIDPVTPTGIKCATFDFPNRVDGLQMFNVLAATARNVLKTCVEEARRIRR